MVLQKQAQQRLLSDIRILLFLVSLSAVCNVLFAFQTHTECQRSCCCFPGTTHSQSQSLNESNSLAYRIAFNFLICIACTNKSFHLLYWSLSTTNLSSNGFHSALNFTILINIFTYFQIFSFHVFSISSSFRIMLNSWNPCRNPCFFSTSNSPSTHRKVTTWSNSISYFSTNY